MNEVIEIFKRRVKIMASYMKDEDGFIIASLVDDSPINDLYNKNIFTLYTFPELLYGKSTKSTDIYKKTGFISKGIISANTHMK